MATNSKSDGIWPCYSKNEIDAVSAVLRSGKVNYWTGQHCRKFEEEFSSFCHTRYAVAVSNGTLALELALRSLGIGPGDDVIVPCRTFIASASTVLNCGARPVFADIDLNSQDITVESIEKVITPVTKAVIAVHLAGWPCEMDGIMDLANRHNLKVIEDCAQAHGAMYKGKPVGSLGHVAAFSFCQDKIISTGGEGGMLVTNDSDVWRKAWSYKDHGKSYDRVFNTQHPAGFRWVHNSIGSNWRMTEMQAAIGRQQLLKLPQWHRRRQHIVARMMQRFREIPTLRVPKPPEYIEHGYYKFDVFLRSELLKEDWNRDRILSEINENGTPCFAGICPEVYLEKAFDSEGLRPKQRLPIARRLGETSLTFLVHPTLSDKYIEKVCDIVNYVLENATESQPLYDSAKLIMDVKLTPHLHGAHVRRNKFRLLEKLS